jgi:hypothetical protein
VGPQCWLPRPLPWKLLADRSDDILGDLFALKDGVFAAQLATDRSAGLPNGSDDALKRAVWTLDDRLQARTRPSVLLQLQGFIMHLTPESRHLLNAPQGAVLSKRQLG